MEVVGSFANELYVPRCEISATQFAEPDTQDGGKRSCCSFIEIAAVPFGQGDHWLREIPTEFLHVRRYRILR